MERRTTYAKRRVDEKFELRNKSKLMIPRMGARRRCRTSRSDVVGCASNSAVEKAADNLFFKAVRNPTSFRTFQYKKHQSQLSASFGFGLVFENFANSIN